MQRKATRQSPAPSRAAKDFLRHQKNKGICDACRQERPLIAHHAEGATFRHNKQYCGPWFILGLCQECDDIVTHGSRKAFREKFGPQSLLWERAIKEYENRGECPKEIYIAILNWGK